MWTRRHFVASGSATCVMGGLRAAGALQGSRHALPFIDSHVHVWKHDAFLPFAPGAHVPAEDASAEMLLDLMRANNVARTVLIQVIHYRWDNRYLADVLRRYPTMFQGVCRVDPQAAAAPDTLRRLTEEDGFRGVRLSPAAGPEGDWFRGPRMPDLWRMCAQLKVPMTLLIPAERLPETHRLIEANPELQVVIDHVADVSAGDGAKLDLLLDLAKYPKVFVKISHMWSVSNEVYPYADAAAQVKRLVEVFGAKRLMAGTDWPVSLKDLGYADAVRLFREHLPFLLASEHEEILFRTVQRIWPFGFDPEISV